MEKFIEELRIELKRRFYDDEVEEVLRYYREIIQDRVDSGESVNTILNSYDVRKIAKEVTPEILQKREYTSTKKVAKGSRSLLRFLFTTPILIPLGILYFAFLVVFIALSFAIVVTSLAGIAAFVMIMIRLFSKGYVDFSLIIGNIGIYLAAISAGLLVLISLAKITKIIAKKMLMVFSKISGKRKKTSLV